MGLWVVRLERGVAVSSPGNGVISFWCVLGFLFFGFWLGGLSLVLVLCEERCMFGGFFYERFVWEFVFLAYDLEGL